MHPRMLSFKRASSYSALALLLLGLVSQGALADASVGPTLQEIAQVYESLESAGTLVQEARNCGTPDAQLRGASAYHDASLWLADSIQSLPREQLSPALAALTHEKMEAAFSRGIDAIGGHPQPLTSCLSGRARRMRIDALMSLYAQRLVSITQDIRAKIGLR